MTDPREEHKNRVLLVCTEAAAARRRRREEHKKVSHPAKTHTRVPHFFVSSVLLL